MGERRAMDPLVVDAVLEIGKRRQEILLKMKEAIRRKDLEAVFHLAEALVDAGERNEGPRTS
jgi:hypothetical protein